MSEPAHITANGIDIAYLEAGPADGPLALCLHGFPDQAPTWEPLMAELGTAGYHAVAPWMRGYAPTSLAPDGNYQVASLALDALALTDALAGEADGNTDAVIVGHDWGALTAYTAVGHRPDRFRRLVTLAVPHPGALGTMFFDPRQLQRSFYMFVFQTPLAEIAVPQDDFAFIDYLWDYWSPGYTPEPGFMRALKDTLAAPGVTEAAIGYYRAMLGTTPGDPALDEVGAAGAGPMPIPTLYLHGADDGCMGVELCDPEALAPLLGGGRAEIVPGTGHFLHLERPDVVNPLILDFLQP
jgi:pimeloyl-ACP methyl ester carboxylesterase